MKVNIKHSNNNLNEIYSVGIKILFIDEEGNSLHEPVLCKDYLSDIILFDRWKELGKPDTKIRLDKVSTIYGFNLEQCRSSNKIALLVDNSNIYLEPCIEFFKKFDKLFPLEKDTAISISKDNKAIIFDFDSFYKKYVYIFSFFTLCLRISLRYSDFNMNLDDFFNDKDLIISSKDQLLKQGKDSGYLKDIISNGNYDIIKSGIFPELSPEYYFNNEIFHKRYGNDSSYSISMDHYHNYSGILNTNLKHYVNNKEEIKEEQSGVKKEVSKKDNSEKYTAGWIQEAINSQEEEDILSI